MARMADAFMRGFGFADQMIRNHRNDQIIEEERARVKSEREGFNKGVGMYIQSKLGQEPNEHSYKVFQEALDDPLSAAEAVERFSDLQEKLDMGTPADQLEKAAVDYFNLPSVAGNRLKERFGANGLSGKLSGMYPAGGDGVFFEADLTTQDGKNYKAPLTVGKTAAGQPGSEQDEVQVYKLKDLMEYGTGAAVTSRAALEYLAQNGGTQGAIFAANYLNEQDKAKRNALLEEFKYQRERADKLADRQSEQQFELTKLGKQHKNAVALEGVKQKNADKDRRGEAGKTFDDLARIFGPEQAAKMVGNKYGKKEVSEYQRVQALDKVQEIIDRDGGVTDTNAPQVNAMLRSIGEPVYERVLDQPASSGFLGMGGSQETYKWIPGTKVESQEEDYQYKGGDVDFTPQRQQTGKYANGSENIKGEHNLDYDLLFKVNAQTESGGRNFRNGKIIESEKGAKSGQQVMPKTAKDPGFEVPPARLTGNMEQDAEEYNRVGRDYLVALINKYKGNVPAAVAAYNMGPGAFDEWVKNGSDPAKMPEETRNHVRKFIANYGAMAPTKDGQGMLAGGPGMAAAGGQAPQQAAKPRPKIDPKKFEVAAPEPQPSVDMNQSVFDEATAQEGQPDTRPFGERAGEAVGMGAAMVKQGASNVADAALAARDFGESFGTTDRWKKIFNGLSSYAKLVLADMQQNGISTAQIVEMADNEKLPLEEFLVKFGKDFAKGLSKGKQSANS